MPDAQDDILNAIIGRSLLTAEAIASQLRRELARRATQAITAFEGVEIARQILDRIEPMLARAISDAEIAAWVAGADEVVSQLPEFVRDAVGSPGRPPAPPPAIQAGEPVIRFPLIERAAEELLERNIVTRPVFDALSREARSRAFTVARIASEDAIETIRDVLEEQVRTGASLRGFRRQVEESLGGSQIGPAHLENVYRTNIQSAFHRAHDELASDPVVAEIFPYQEYLATHDGRVREEHLALESLGLNGTGIYRRDDPMWDLFTPPWDYQCRCGVRLLTIEAAARAGVLEAIEWLETGIPPQNREHRLDAIPFRPRPEFVSGKPVRLQAGETLTGPHPCGPTGGSSPRGGGAFRRGNWCWTLTEKHIEALIGLRIEREAALEAAEKRHREAEEADQKQKELVARRKKAAFKRTQRYRDIVETLGTSDFQVVSDFAGLMDDVHKRLASQAQEYNEAFDELVDQVIGKDAAGRINRGSLVSQLRRAPDPAVVPRFDELVQFVENHPEIRTILAAELGESTGNDLEAMTFQGLRRGKKEIPGNNSEQVWQEALAFLGGVDALDFGEAA